MTVLALLLKNRGDVFSKGDLSLCRGPVCLRLYARWRHTHRDHHHENHWNDATSAAIPGSPHGLHLDTSLPKLLSEMLNFPAASIFL